MNIARVGISVVRVHSFSVSAAPRFAGTRALHLASSRTAELSRSSKQFRNATFVPLTITLSRRGARSYWWSSKTPSAVATTAPFTTSPISENASPAATPDAFLSESPSSSDPPISDLPEPVSESTSSASDISPTDAYGIPLPTGDNLGDLAALDLAHSTPTGLVQSALEHLHVTFGLPWWASIITLVVITRVIILPITINLQANASRLAVINPELQAIMAKTKLAKQNNDTGALTTNALKAQHLMKKHNANPFKGILGPAIQFPLALSFFFGIKAMCNLPVETMKTGGLWWFTDLTAADPYFVLPVLSAGAVIAMMRAARQDNPQTEVTGHTSNFITAVSIISIPAIAVFPSGILVYLVANGFALFAQSAILRIPSLRRRAGILPPPVPPTTPFGAPINTNPSYKESFLAAKNYLVQKAKDDQERATANARRKQALRQAGDKEDRDVLMAVRQQRQLREESQKGKEKRKV